MEHRQYLQWKRNNVTIRGISDSKNSGGNRFGKGLYTAFLSNKDLAKMFGKPYFVLNAIPKKPKVFNDTNQAEIWIHSLLQEYCVDIGLEIETLRDYEKKDLISVACMRINIDGIVIKGREMVNFSPSNDVIYFDTEDKLKTYYKNNI